MKKDFQRDKIIENIKKLKGTKELQDYLRDSVPYEYLLDMDFVNKITDANPMVKRFIEGVLVDKEYEQAEEYEYNQKLDTIEKIKKYIEEVDIYVALAKHRDEILKLARFYEEEGEYNEAKKYYSLIVERGRNQKEKFMRRAGYDDKDTVYYKAKIGELACKSNMGQDLTETEKDELEVSLEKVSSKQESVDAFLTYFTPIASKLLNENFDAIMNKGGTRKANHRSATQQSVDQDREYIAELSPDKRLKYLVENYNISKVYTGLGIFEGSVVLDVEDKNILIVEKFYEPKYEGEELPRPAYGKSTIIVSKDIELNIAEMTRGKLVEMGRNGNTHIKKVNHRGEKYYARLDASIEKVSKGNVEKNIEHEELTKTDAFQEKQAEKKQDDIKKETPRTMETVLSEMENLDLEYTNLKALLEKAEQEQENVKNLRKQVEDIKVEVNNAISGTMTSKISSIVIEQMNLLKEMKQQLKEIELSAETLSVQECEIKIKENREKREKLNEEIKNILGE